VKIFITGASGSLGTELLKQLKYRFSDNRIIAFSLDPTLIRDDSTEYVVGDICHLSDEYLKNSLSDVDVIIHLAALVHQPKAPKDKYYQVNYLATRKLSEAFSKYSASLIKQFIYISSVAVYGNYQSLPYSEESHCLPDTPYGESKFLAENHLRNSFTNTSLHYTILRPATIYGGQSDRGNIAKMIRLLMKWRVFPLFNSGDALKSFVYVGDVAKAIIDCLNNKITFGQTYNISAPALSLKTIVDLLARRFGFTVIFIPVPLLFFKRINLVKQLFRHNSYSFQKAKDVLHYNPHTFPDGL
jgi:nucleoside-diphosphate-sugar epimerase